MSVGLEATPEIAIVGGGPGGLITAYLLQHRYPTPCRVTIFEASNRLGGKVRTARFKGDDVAYEAGAAELYDYSDAGPDPLKALVETLGLSTRFMEGHAVFIGDELIRSSADLARVYGPDAQACYNAFIDRARSLISPSDYYESDWREDNQDPLARQSFAELLETIEDARVRRYIAVLVHSDVAAEPTDCSAVYGLHNLLMNEPGYMKLYSIDGGVERLTSTLAQCITATVRLDHRVTRVQPLAADRLRVTSRHGGQMRDDDFDAVVIAMPNYWIPSIEFVDPSLANAMARHHAYYDYPAHYLRITLRFSRPFWRGTVEGSYFMLDAFGGCCVYDESLRQPGSHSAILGWLLAGDAAMTLSNLDDDALICRALDSLPEPLREGRKCYLEGAVYRWVGSVSARPGGFPMREPDSRHVPDPVNNPMLFVVGDYLFDSTLNGAYDSADTVASWISEEFASEPADVSAGAIPPPRIATDVVSLMNRG